MNSPSGLKLEELNDVISIPAFSSTDISIFQKFLGKYASQCINANGSVYLSVKPDGTVTGMMTGDPLEGEGAIFTRDMESFSLLLPNAGEMAIFSELKLSIKGERYLVMNADVRLQGEVRSSGNSIEVASLDNLEDLMKCINSIFPRTRKTWVYNALVSGDECFMVRVGDEVVGFGFVSISHDQGRLSLIGVLPAYRGNGIATDIMRARMIFLRTLGIKTVFSEISEHNIPSLKLAKKFGFRESGELWRYEPPSGSWSSTVGAFF